MNATVAAEPKKETAAARLPSDLHKVLSVKAAHTGRTIIDLLDEILRPALREDGRTFGCPLATDKGEGTAE